MTIVAHGRDTELRDLDGCHELSSESRCFRYLQPGFVDLRYVAVVNAAKQWAFTCGSRDVCFQQFPLVLYNEASQKHFLFKTVFLLRKSRKPALVKIFGI